MTGSCGREHRLNGTEWQNKSRRIRNRVSLESFDYLSISCKMAHHKWRERTRNPGRCDASAPGSRSGSRTQTGWQLGPLADSESEPASIGAGNLRAGPPRIDHWAGPDSTGQKFWARDSINDHSSSLLHLREGLMPPRVEHDHLSLFDFKKNLKT